jgi:hypothetical protein
MSATRRNRRWHPRERVAVIDRTGAPGGARSDERRNGEDDAARRALRGLMVTAIDDRRLYPRSR